MRVVRATILILCAVVILESTRVASAQTQQPLLPTAAACLEVGTRAEWARVPVTSSAYARAQRCIALIDASGPLPPERQPTTAPAIPDVPLPTRTTAPLPGPATGDQQPAPAPRASETASARPSVLPSAVPNVPLPSGSGAPVVAQVVGTGGFLRRAGVNQEVPVGDGFALRIGDTISTRDRPVVFQFSDGSKIEIGPRSSFHLEEDEPNALRQELGRIRYLIQTKGVACLFDAACSRRIKIRAQQSSFSIRGTIFSVEVLKDGGVQLDVEEGTVEVEAGGKTVEVSAGSSTIVRRDRAPDPPVATSTLEEAGKAQTRRWITIGLGLLALCLLGAGGWALLRRGSRRARPS